MVADKDLPKIWVSQIFWAARENLSKSVFKDVSMFISFNYFEDLNINLKSA